jgi:tetrahydromethanopterin S-methyltransferase subunit B
LVPLNLKSPHLTSKNPISGFETAAILAGFRDAVASSNKDLEERVRKLENTISRIISKCCKEAEAE